MSLRNLAALAAVSSVAAFASPAGAFDRGCGGWHGDWHSGGGRAIACYEKVKQPDVYATVQRPVVVRPAFTQVVTSPPVTEYRAEKVLVREGSWHSVEQPAEYASRTERVLVRAAETNYIDEPPVTRTVRESVVVQPASSRWEHSRGFLGRGERMCQVEVAAVTRDVERQVVVTPGRRVAQVQPAVYENVTRNVIVRPASHQKVYEPPVYSWANRQIVVREAQQHVIQHPAVTSVEHRQVLVREGGIGWAPARHRGLFGLFDHH